MIAIVCLFFSSYGIISMLNQQDSKFNYKFTIPWSSSGSQVDMVSMGFNFTYQYILNVTEILFKKIFFPKHLTNLKGKSKIIY